MTFYDGTKVTRFSPFYEYVTLSHVAQLETQITRRGENIVAPGRFYYTLYFPEDFQERYARHL